MSLSFCPHSLPLNRLFSADEPQKSKDARLSNSIPWYFALLEAYVMKPILCLHVCYEAYVRCLLCLKPMLCLLVCIEHEVYVCSDVCSVQSKEVRKKRLQKSVALAVLLRLQLKQTISGCWIESVGRLHVCHVNYSARDRNKFVLGDCTSDYSVNSKLFH